MGRNTPRGEARIWTGGGGAAEASGNGEAMGPDGTHLSLQLLCDGGEGRVEPHRPQPPDYTIPVTTPRPMVPSDGEEHPGEHCGGGQGSRAEGRIWKMGC